MYVKKGSLTIDGRVCPVDGDIILEAGVPAVVRANEPTTVVHFGPWDPNPPTTGAYGAPEEEGRTVHVVGPGGTFALIERDARRSSTPTPVPTVAHHTAVHVARRSVPFEAAQSFRRRDHLLLSGEIQVGQTILKSGDAIGIAGDRRYRFKGGEQGFGFLNYRRDASYSRSRGQATVPRRRRAARLQQGDGPALGAQLARLLRRNPTFS